MDIPTLTHNILSKQSINTLYSIYSQKEITDIEREIQLRLLSCDRKLYDPLVEFLYNYQNDLTVKRWLESIYVREGIRGAVDCIPWKIGLIYDYRDQSYRIKQIDIIVGKPIAYKTLKGYFKPTWSESERTKLALREIISGHNIPINNVISIVTIDPKLDNAIRKKLLENNEVTITTCVFIPPIGSSFKSYPNSGYLSHPEMKQMYPCHIKVGDLDHDLITYPGNIAAYNPQTFNVKITRSSDLSKLIHLKNKLNIP